MDGKSLFFVHFASKALIISFIEAHILFLLQDVSSEFVSRYSWTCGETHADSCDETRADSCDGRSTHHCDIEYKWLPVCRPKNPINIRFTELPQV